MESLPRIQEGAEQGAAIFRFGVPLAVVLNPAES